MVLLSYLQRFDRYCYCLFSGLRAKGMPGQIALLTSRSGDGYAYLVISLIAWFTDEYGDDYFTHLLLGFLFQVPVYWIMKNSFRRQRPSELNLSFAALIVASDKFSFPSGHTAAAVLFAIITYHYYPTSGLVCFAWATGIGASRVVVGVHYPSDIVAGAVLALLVSELVL
ncbi:phosphatase PAP2 family protein [Idiomarina sp. HP20-50]|uniref:phosphatase PAP2 family protein n=1 Tax=Idiomarina sp. HP20-50 TaxID=3070813 RepID=UPI00294B2C37|nr:phosphatase PAP2 family protein [Idiomarina sp. HP20-50]MDV6317208.1 phosphatase PAP2 family protein [Idiomarina sp. HP20-50]